MRDENWGEVGNRPQNVSGEDLSSRLPKLLQLKSYSRSSPDYVAMTPYGDQAQNLEMPILLFFTLSLVSIHRSLQTFPFTLEGPTQQLSRGAGLKGRYVARANIVSKVSGERQ